MKKLLLSITLLLIPTITFASWAHVQTTHQHGYTGTNVKAYASANTAGNLLVVAIVWANTQTFTSVADSQSNTYAQVGAEQTFSGFNTRIYYAKNCKAGANTVTLTISAGTGWNAIYLSEYSGLSTTAPYVTGQVTFNSVASGVTTFTSNNVTTTVANSLLYGFVMPLNYSPTVEGTWTSRDGNIVADKNAPMTTTYAFTGTLSGSDGYGAWIAAFVPPGQVIMVSKREEDR